MGQVDRWISPIDTQAAGETRIKALRPPRSWNLRSPENYGLRSVGIRDRESNQLSLFKWLFFGK